MISIKENVNSVEEFNYLYDAVLWGNYDKKVSEFICFDFYKYILNSFPIRNLF